MLVALAIFLLWVFVSMVLYYWLASATDAVPGVRSSMKKMLVGPKCPTCGERFVPSKCRWEVSTKCLDGKDYCDACKVQAKCGC